jgi:predicted ATP-binding protein involved in virulence
MKLNHITIENFRAISKLELPLEPQLTLLVGNNAAGKTTILDAIAVGLGAVLARLPNTSNKDFCVNDQRQELVTCFDEPTSTELSTAPYARVTLETTNGIIWDRTQKRDLSELTQKAIPPAKNLSTLHAFLDPIINDVQNGNLKTKLPLIAYYGTDRAVFPSVQQQLHANPLQEFNRFGALEGSLEAITHFHSVFEWFTAQENQEFREIKKRQDWHYQLPVLKAVRQSLCQMLPGCSNPRTDTKPSQFLVDFEYDDGKKEILALSQLSDGYRTTLALVIDLARRMAQANPPYQENDNPLESEAIILIDEVDLHLHPKWQQHILVNLMETFPNAQFIVTTHSASVLTTIKPKHIIRLEREDEVIAEQPTSSYGAESGRLLSEIMDVDERPPADVNEFTRLFEQYYELIERNEGDRDAALKLRSRLNELSGDDPDLITADMEIERRRVLYGTQQGSTAD